MHCIFPPWLIPTETLRLCARNITWEVYAGSACSPSMYGQEELSVQDLLGKELKSEAGDLPSAPVCQCSHALYSSDSSQRTRTGSCSSVTGRWPQAVRGKQGKGPPSCCICLPHRDFSGQVAGWKYAKAIYLAMKLSCQKSHGSEADTF